jgi:hypothetical protein
MRLAIIGGGPSALLLFKAFCEENPAGCVVEIFERGQRLGAGMPYSHFGANVEHVTNVSGNEIPQLVTPLVDWIKAQSAETLKPYRLDPKQLHDFKVIPRLLFGDYLAAQFDQLIAAAQNSGMATSIHLQTRVVDIEESPQSEGFILELADGQRREFDVVVVCTGHVWKKQLEGTHAGYFDSPYPPQKLARRFNHRIAVRGTSLTAIDAVRTLALQHGAFVKTERHQLAYRLRADCPDFKIVLHSREGFLPGIRFHLDDPQLSKKSLLSESILRQHRDTNDGYVSLDYLFEEDFKAMFREAEPVFYALIKEMQLEEFVAAMLREREHTEPFAFFKQEYAEALRSIRREESIYWKEKLAILSFALNYPAKYFSAEDRLRLQKALMPLISLVIAFVPQGSCEQLIALHDAGILSLQEVGQENQIEPQPAGGIIYHYGEGDHEQSVAFDTFIDCVGQKPLAFEEFPFPSLTNQGKVRPATLAFRDAAAALKELAAGNREIEQTANGDYELRVPGIAIDDNYRIIDRVGQVHPRFFVMAVPLIAGYNPDYSGLDFCEYAAKKIVASILRP